MRAMPIRPVLTEFDFGPAGWRELHDLARQRGRHPREQIKAMTRYALYRALRGEDVELTRSQLEELLERVA